MTTGLRTFVIFEINVRIFSEVVISNMKAALFLIFISKRKCVLYIVIVYVISTNYYYLICTL